MWQPFLNFQRPCFFQEHLDELTKAGKQLPYVPAEQDRVRFGLPFAYVALYFDSLDIDGHNISEDRKKASKEFCLGMLLTFAGLRTSVMRRIGDMLATEHELQLAKDYTAGRLKLFENLSSHRLSEAEIINLVWKLRMELHLAALMKAREQWPSLFGTPDTRNANRHKFLAYSLNAFVTGDIDEADDRRKVNYLCNVFYDAQTFYDKIIAGVNTNKPSAN